MNRDTAERWYWIVMALVGGFIVCLFMGVLSNRIHDATHEAKPVSITVLMIGMAVVSIISMAFGKWVAKVEAAVSDDEPASHKALVRASKTIEAMQITNKARDELMASEKEQLKQQFDKAMEEFASAALKLNQAEEQTAALRGALIISEVFQSQATINMGDLAMASAKMAFQAIKVVAGAAKLAEYQEDEIGRVFLAGFVNEAAPIDGVGILLYHSGQVSRFLLHAGVQLYYLSELPKAVMTRRPDQNAIPLEQLVRDAIESIDATKFVEEAGLVGLSDTAKS
jgi:hypothetical protein